MKIMTKLHISRHFIEFLTLRFCICVAVTSFFYAVMIELSVTSNTVYYCCYKHVDFNVLSYKLLLYHKSKWPKRDHRMSGFVQI